MEHHYFIVLELPGGEELRFIEGKGSPKDFWAKAEAAVNRGNAKLICKRQDTGVSEDVRARAYKAKRFTTFMLVDMQFNDNETPTRRNVLKKVGEWLKTHTSEILVDTTAQFQLVSVEA